MLNDNSCGLLWCAPLGAHFEPAGLVNVITREDAPPFVAEPPVGTGTSNSVD